MSFLTPAWRAAMRTRVTHPTLADARRALDTTIAAYHDWLPPPPERQAGYYHEFFCPRHAVQLVFDPRQPRRHVCPSDGEVFSGEPFDSAWRWSVNDLLSDAALKLAFRGALGGAEADGDAAVATRLLTGYAERYRTIPPIEHIHRTHPGVVCFSGLDESVWIIRLVWAYTLLGDRLPATVAEQIRQDLFQPAADHLWRVRWPEIHNVTCWNNAALATLAIALNDETRLTEVLDGPLGLREQVAQGVRADGLWWEGSLSYHYYTLAALIWAERVLRATGRTLANEGTLERMFLAPLRIAFPDLTLPAMNDCWYAISLTGEAGHGIPNAAGFYEIGFGWYHRPAFAWVLGQNYARRPRASFEALLDGAPLPSAPAPPPSGHHLAAPSGIAVVRSPSARTGQTCLLLKAGPSGDGHGHPDQLSIQLFAHGQRQTPDLGTPGYGIDLNETWYRQTASHSTVLLDGQSQPLADGRITRFDMAADTGLVEGTVSWNDGSYAGVTMRRRLVWRRAYCIDVFEVECPAPRQIDWLFHHRGQVVGAVSAAPLADGLTGDGGYAHLSDVCLLTDVDGQSLRWQRADAGLVLALPPGAEQRLLATAPGNPAHERLSVLLRRRIARRTRFVAVIVPFRATARPSARVTDWRVGGRGTVSVALQTPYGPETWSIGSVIRRVQ